MKTRFTLALVALISLVTLFQVGAESKASKPRSNEVVLVAKFAMSPALDQGFYSQYIDFHSASISTWGGKKGGAVPDNTVFLASNGTLKANIWGNGIAFGTLGDIDYAKVSIPRHREIQIDGVRVYILGNPFLYFDLPILRKIVVPEGVNYVYLGTFTYKMKDEFFMISDISKSDEFDAAAEALAKVYGKDAQLTRVNLLDIEDKDAKK